MENVYTEKAKQRLQCIQDMKNAFFRYSDLAEMLRDELATLEKQHTGAYIKNPSNRRGELLKEYAETEEKLTEKAEQLLKLRSIICEEVERLDNDKQKNILFLIYVKGVRIKTIAEKMGYCVRQIEKIRSAAVDAYGELIKQQENTEG